MSLSPAAVAWQQKWAREVSQVQPSVTVAGHKRVLANSHLDNARQLLLAKRYDLALTNAEHALVSGADAVLRLHGFEVTGHVSRFAYPDLPKTYTQQRSLIAQIRTARNAAQYDAPGRVSPKLAKDAVDLAQMALNEVNALIP